MADLVGNLTKLENTLYEQNDAFFKRVFGQKEKETAEFYSQKNKGKGDEFKQYEQLAE
jgi:hypothetical protein